MFGFSKAKAKPKTLGQLGEEFAQQEYKKRGYKVIAANFFNRKGKRLGEVDFIATGSGDIAFVEVKSRTGETGKFGLGAEAVDGFKQIKLLKAVRLFLLGHAEYRHLRPHIDVCVVQVIDSRPASAIIIPNAVEDCG